MDGVLATAINRNKHFSATHPAIDFRFKTHAKWLSVDGWDDAINEHTPEIFSQLQKHKELRMKDFVITPKPPLEENKTLEEELHTWMLDRFEKMVAKIDKEVSAKLDKSENPIDDFRKNNGFVTNCLEHGVVPSTVYNERKEKCHPNPTTILNSGFFFYLGGMDALLDKVKNNDSDVDKRMNYEKRLNQWLAKAIEDWQILLEEGKL